MIQIHRNFAFGMPEILAFRSHDRAAGVRLFLTKAFENRAQWVQSWTASGALPLVFPALSSWRSGAAYGKADGTGLLYRDGKGSRTDRSITHQMSWPKFQSTKYSRGTSPDWTSTTVGDLKLNAKHRRLPVLKP